MHSIGLLLITLGFLAGSLVAVIDPEAIDWAYFVPCVAVGAIGVGLVQLAIKRAASDPVRTQANFAILHHSLGAIVDNLATLDGGKADLDVYQLPDRIDHTFRKDIHAFVDARESIAHTCGMQPYADIMSHFAAGERYLNRVWSCAADGYIDEAHEYIARSHEQFGVALERLLMLEHKVERAEASAGRGADDDLPAARVVTDTAE